MTEKQMVVFGLGQEKYAIPIERVQEIIPYRTATKLPQTLDFMDGIIELRGKIIPVIELAKRLKLMIEAKEDRRIIIVDTNGHRLGVVVDEVNEVLCLAESEVEKISELGSNADGMSGIGKAGGRLLILLDLDELFAEPKLAEISLGSS